MTPCHEWTGTLDTKGYGVRGQPKQYMHRVVWEHVHGPIPRGLEIDHLCFNRACMNVKHLRLATRSENARRQRKALQDHCINGHTRTAENIWVRSDRRHAAARECRICHRERNRRYDARQREHRRFVARDQSDWNAA